MKIIQAAADAAAFFALTKLPRASPTSREPPAFRSEALNKRILVIAVFVISCAVAQAIEIDRALAKQYFAEAQQMCNADGGKLWGASLCGPMFFSDPQTRAIVANAAAVGLQAQDGLFIGTLPNEISMANTATEWSGIWWTQVMWPLPTDTARRRVLLAHEAFHRLQKSFPRSNAVSDNVGSLDSVNGRYLLQMEWRALAKALNATGQQRREFVKDALLFRARRHELFTSDAARESQQLSNEGLAEYTGIKLGGKDVEEQKQLALNDLESAGKKASFVRSFAYGSGPAYGLLLDDAQPHWRANELTSYRAMEDLLCDALRIELPQDVAAASESRAAKYDGAALLVSENEREKQRLARVASLRALLVDGPVLRIPLRQMQISFNPNNLQPLDDLGTAYPNLRISDVWGVLEVSKGALISPNWNQATVTAPTHTSGPKLEGDGWTLELKEGWKLKAAERKGDFLLVND